MGFAAAVRGIGGRASGLLGAVSFGALFLAGLRRFGDEGKAPDGL